MEMLTLLIKTITETLFFECNTHQEVTDQINKTTNQTKIIAILVLDHDKQSCLLLHGDGPFEILKNTILNEILEEYEEKSDISVNKITDMREFPP